MKYYYLYHDNKELSLTLTQVHSYISAQETKPISLPAIHKHANHPVQPHLIRGSYLISNTQLKIEDVPHIKYKLRTYGMPQSNNSTNNRYISIVKPTKDRPVQQYIVSYKGTQRLAPTLEIAKTLLDKMLNTSTVEEQRRIASKQEASKLTTSRVDNDVRYMEVNEETGVGTYMGVEVSFSEEGGYTFNFPIGKKANCRQDEKIQYYVNVYNHTYHPVALLILMHRTGCSNKAQYRFIDGNRQNYHYTNLELVKDYNMPKKRGLHRLGVKVSKNDIRALMIKFIEEQKDEMVKSKQTYRAVTKVHIGMKLMLDNKEHLFREALKDIPDMSWFKKHRHYVEILA